MLRREQRHKILWHSSMSYDRCPDPKMTRMLQPVPEKMRLEMVIGMQIEILDGHNRSLCKWLIWKETWTLTIEDFDLHSDDHFKSHLVGNGLYNVNNAIRSSDVCWRRTIIVTILKWRGCYDVNNTIRSYITFVDVIRYCRDLEMTTILCLARLRYITINTSFSEDNRHSFNVPMRSSKLEAVQRRVRKNAAPTSVSANTITDGCLQMLRSTLRSNAKLRGQKGSRQQKERKKNARKCKRRGEHLPPKLWHSFAALPTCHVWLDSLIFVCYIVWGVCRSYSFATLCERGGGGRRATLLVRRYTGALLRVYRALWRMYRILWRIRRAFWQIHRAILRW